MTQARTVLVVGRKAASVPELNGTLLFGAGICILTIGWPVTAVQSALVERAIDAARDARVPVEAILVTSDMRATDHLRTDDDVRVVAPRRESMRLARALAAVGIDARPL
ncbi:MAG: hypothetical protein ACM3OO_06045 [Planctomycetaceae bacterium]